MGRHFAAPHVAVYKHLRQKYGARLEVSLMGGPSEPLQRWSTLAHRVNRPSWRGCCTDFTRVVLPQPTC
eukprot:1740879-Alexandrium_andersonii.AAC.1